MSIPAPHEHHSDDARSDDGPPTDAFTDEVREEAADAESPSEATDDECRRHPGPG